MTNGYLQGSGCHKKGGRVDLVFAMCLFSHHALTGAYQMPVFHLLPGGVEVVSWYVMMGIGQVVTLRVPAEKLRDVNRAIELRAWGAFRTDFYATYDYKPIWEADLEKAH